MKLQGLTALVTGAAQGIGAAIVREFVREGATVAAVDLQHMDACTGVLPYQFDITDQESFRRCVEEVAATRGRIEILVNNAAISFYADILQDRLEDWRRTMQVNLEAVYWASKLVAPVMAKHGWGRIINISSMQALATEGCLGAYAASKGGIVSLTRSLAVDLAPYGILANAIAPGCIHTPMSVINGIDETQTEFFQTWYVGKRKIPLARPGEPEEIARICVFLASEDCSYITGHTLVADGGLSITF
jgi:NAD(P)-dependent dehydrogenase (short-subunit alcohol dehydrogenase family)